MIRAAPTVWGSSTSSRIGSGLDASTTTGSTPGRRRHASASGWVRAGTTEPIAAPVIAPGTMSAIASSPPSCTASSSGVRDGSVVSRQ